jgi:tetratricopeptide (TPR) repeat protein
MEALRDLEELGKEFRDRGIEIVAVAEPGAPRQSIDKASRELALSYPLYTDTERRASEAYGVIVYPSTGIISPDRRLKFYLPSRNSNYRDILRGRIRVELGELTEKEFTQRMLQIGEEMGGERAKAEEHLKAGLILSRQGKGRQAVQEFRQALELDRDLIDAHLAIGYAYLDTGEIEGARKEFTWVLERHPTSPGARVGMGIAEIRLGRLDQGINILEKAVGLNPDPVQAYFELGQAYEKKGNTKEALHAYKWAVRKLLQGRR